MLLGPLVRQTIIPLSAVKLLIYYTMGACLSKDHNVHILKVHALHKKALLCNVLDDLFFVYILTGIATLYRHIIPLFVAFKDSKY